MIYSIGDKVFIITKWGRREFVITSIGKFGCYLDDLFWVVHSDIDGLVEE